MCVCVSMSGMCQYRSAHPCLLLFGLEGRGCQSPNDLSCRTITTTTTITTRRQACSSLPATRRTRRSSSSSSSPSRRTAQVCLDIYHMFLRMGWGPFHYYYKYYYTHVITETVMTPPPTPQQNKQIRQCTVTATSRSPSSCRTRRPGQRRRAACGSGCGSTPSGRSRRSSKM